VRALIALVALVIIVVVVSSWLVASVLLDPHENLVRDNLEVLAVSRGESPAAVG